MKSLATLLIQFLRSFLFYTPVRNWRLTAYIYGKVARLQTGPEPYPVVAFEGVRIKANAEDSILTSGLINDQYEKFTLRIMKSLLTEARGSADRPVFVDIGANIGVFAVIAGTTAPDLNIFAFEPNPHSFGLLRDNLELNGVQGVTTVQAAIGAAEGTASLDVSSPSAGLHSIHGGGSKRLEVPVLSLDRYLGDQGLQPRLIKVDVEGYEPAVLRGMAQILNLPELVMILEFNPALLKQGGREPAEFLEELSALFDHVFSIDEMDHVLFRYERGNARLKSRLCSIGFNLLLVKGPVPECARHIS